MHHAIQQEGRPSQISRILQHPEKEKQNQNLRKKNNHSTDAGQYPVHQKIPKDSGRHLGLNQLPQCTETSINPLHRIGGDGENGNKERHHHPGQDSPTCDRMKYQRVDTIGPSHLFPAMSDPRLTQDIPEVGVPCPSHRRRPVIGLLAEALTPSQREFAGSLRSLA